MQSLVDFKKPDQGWARDGTGESAIFCLGPDFPAGQPCGTVPRFASHRVPGPSRDWARFLSGNAGILVAGLSRRFLSRFRLSRWFQDSRDRDQDPDKSRENRQSLNGTTRSGQSFEILFAALQHFCPDNGCHGTTTISAFG